MPFGAPNPDPSAVAAYFAGAAFAVVIVMSCLIARGMSSDARKEAASALRRATEAEQKRDELADKLLVMSAELDAARRRLVLESTPWGGRMPPVTRCTPSEN